VQPSSIAGSFVALKIVPRLICVSNTPEARAAANRRDSKARNVRHHLAGDFTKKMEPTTRDSNSLSNRPRRVNQFGATKKFILGSVQK
jgi:hypothetical protein